jgi:hypothetical protein
MAGPSSAGLAGAASSRAAEVADAQERLARSRSRGLAEGYEQFENSVAEFKLRAAHGEVLTAHHFDHRGVLQAIFSYTFCEAGAPQGAATRPAGRERDAPSRPPPAKAAATGGKGGAGRPSPSAGISGMRLNNWKKKHCADGTLRPGAGRRVAARTAKRRAGGSTPARQETTTAPRSSPAAAETPKANASSRAPAKPAQTRTSSESDSDEDSELPSGSEEDSEMEDSESLSDATEAMAARCFVGGAKGGSTR